MKSLWKNNFTVENIKEKTPKYIIEEQCKILNEKTDGKIIGRVSAYDNRVVASQTPYFGKPKLGEVSDGVPFTYEFFITSKQTSKYRYGVLLLEYSISIYPATIVLDSVIASEVASQDKIIINNEEEFIDLLSLILNSYTVTSVIKNLLALN